VIWSEVLGDNLYKTLPAKTFLASQHPSLSNLAPLLEPLIYINEIPVPKKMLPMMDFMERLDRNTKPHTRIVIKAEEQQRMTQLAEIKEQRTL
jgi:hypothetical protein